MGDRSLATPPDPHAAAGAVLASIHWVYAVWYAATHAPGHPSQPRSTGSPARGTTPPSGRGSRPAHSWRHCGSTARCRSFFTQPDRGVVAPGGRPATVAFPTPPSNHPCPAPPPPQPAAGRQACPRAPPPPPARGSGRQRISCMASQYGESSGKPWTAPQAACEPQDRPSNQIKSNPMCRRPLRSLSSLAKARATGGDPPSRCPCSPCCRCWCRWWCWC